MNLLLLTHLLIGPLILLLSLIFLRYPPKKINHYYGYRTKRSMKSQEAWDLAHRYSNQLLLKVSILTCIIQIITYFLFESDTSILISAAVLVLGIIAIFPMTERLLKQRFDQKS